MSLLIKFMSISLKQKPYQALIWNGSMGKTQCYIRSYHICAALPRSGSFWSCGTFGVQGSKGSAGGCMRCKRSSAGSRGRGSRFRCAGGCTGRGCWWFGGAGFTPALQGVECDPSGLRFGFHPLWCAFLFWTRYARGLWGCKASRSLFLLFLRSRCVGLARHRGSSPAIGGKSLAFLLIGRGWGHHLQRRPLLQRGAEFPLFKWHEGTVAISGRHCQEGAITRPVEQCA